MGKKKKNVEFVDLEKCCKMSIHLQNLVPIQRRTSRLKFDFAEKSERGSVSNLSTKVSAIGQNGFGLCHLSCRCPTFRAARPWEVNNFVETFRFLAQSFDTSRVVVFTAADEVQIGEETDFDYDADE